MDKVAINAVAGSGKTEYIIKKLDDKTRTLILTYTTPNQVEIKERIINKFGHIPTNISVMGIFSFLYSFCLRPFEKKCLKGINFTNPHFSQAYAIDTNSYIYSNRLSKYIIDNYKNDVLSRIDKYFDNIFIDEMQDFASDDFDFMLVLSQLSIPVTLVGDFFQHTYNSSMRGNKGKGVYKNFNEYNKCLTEGGYFVDFKTLSTSYRCSAGICEFIEEGMGIAIKSNTTKRHLVEFVSNPQNVEEILRNDNIVKLFIKEHYKYNCNSNNWGNSKGATYKEVCVVLNPTSLANFKKNTLCELAPSTFSKLYVACTRSLTNVYFIAEKDIPNQYRRW